MMSGMKTIIFKDLPPVQEMTVFVFRTGIEVSQQWLSLLLQEDGTVQEFVKEKTPYINHAVKVHHRGLKII